MVSVSPIAASGLQAQQQSQKLTEELQNKALETQELNSQSDESGAVESLREVLTTKAIKQTENVQKAEQLERRLQDNNAPSIAEQIFDLDPNSVQKQIAARVESKVQNKGAVERAVELDVLGEIRIQNVQEVAAIGEVVAEQEVLEFQQAEKEFSSTFPIIAAEERIVAEEIVEIETESRTFALEQGGVNQEQRDQILRAETAFAQTLELVKDLAENKELAAADVIEAAKNVFDGVDVSV